MTENIKFGIINAKMIGIYSRSHSTIDGSKIYEVAPIIPFENYKHGKLKGIKVKDTTFFKFGYETADFQINESDILFARDRDCLDSLSEGDVVTFQAKIEISQKVLTLKNLCITDIEKYQDKKAIQKIKNLIEDNFVSYKFFYQKPKNLKEFKRILNDFTLHRMSLRDIIFYLLCLIRNNDSFIVMKDFKKYASYLSEKEMDLIISDLIVWGFLSEPCFDYAYEEGFPSYM